MATTPRAVLTVLFAAALATAQSSLRLANVFGSNMVLQRDAPAPVWGWAAPGDSVQATFNAQKFSATADGAGLWQIVFPPTPAGGPFTLGFTASSSGSATLTNVLVGDVLLCAGQSNMAFTVMQSFNASAECARGTSSRYANLRVMAIGHTTAGSPTPTDELVSIPLQWSEPSTRSICQGGQFAAGFSAVCYFTGRNLFDAFEGKVPIGLISSAAASTAIDQWSPPEAIAQCPLHRDHNRCNGISGCLWNNAIYPLVHAPLPLALKAMIWYQAENDYNETSRDSLANSYYACAFPALITAWRARFQERSLPFLFVLLAPWDGPNDLLPATRLAQLNATLLPSVGYASAYDRGDPNAPLPGHPRDKATIGTRMTAVALNLVYGQGSVAYRGPVFSSRASSGSGSALTVTISFDGSTLSDCGTGAPLVLNRTVACPPLSIGSCEAFAVYTSEGTWRNASASLTPDGTQLVLGVEGAAAGTTALGSRGMHAAWPLAVLSNGCGLPVQPWREGAWGP